MIPLDLPSGIYRNGTEYQARGRWYDCNLIRFYEQTVRPMKGWLLHSASVVSGAARAIVAWSDNSSLHWIGIGTHSNLYVMTRSGTLSDITPAGYTAGRADATTLGGYGMGSFGESAYGTPRADTAAGLDATVWSLDFFGEDLVGCNADDGFLYQWELDPSTPAAKVTAAPINNRSVLVTEEGIVMLLGAGGNPRMVQWCDFEDLTDWTPTSANAARFQTLQTAGRLMCGRRTTGGILIFTDVDVFLATYVELPDIYNFERKGQGCGVVSQNAAIATGDGLVAWMTADGFWTFNGYIQPLASDVGDYVFGDFNRGQQTKVFAHHNNAFGEIEWWYPSGGSNEVDRFVRWNYRENHWTTGELTRLCGVEKGALNFPLMVDASGQVWEHEQGYDYSGGVPFIESGPYELDADKGPGGRVLRVTNIWPDERLDGQVNMSFTTRLDGPNGAETSYGPYTLANPTNVHFEARQVKMRFEGVELGDWRIGSFRAEARPMGAR